MNKQIKLVVPDKLYSVLQAESRATGNSVASLVRATLVQAYQSVIELFEKGQPDNDV